MNKNTFDRRYLQVTAFFWFLSVVTMFFLTRELGLSVVSSVQASDTPPPAPAVEEPEEDGLRARVRRRLEETPPPESAAIAAAPSNNDQDVKSLFAKLQAQKKELDEKSAALLRREQSLAEREALVKTQLNRYEETLMALRMEVDSLRGLKNKKLEEFRKVYSKMEPKKAARILDDMDTDLAGQILSSLKESQSAEILATMDPEKARRITARFLTGRSFAGH